MLFSRWSVIIIWCRVLKCALKKHGWNENRNFEGLSSPDIKTSYEAEIMKSGFGTKIVGQIPMSMEQKCTLV